LAADVLGEDSQQFLEAKAETMKNILILDNDLGFIYWLGAVLIGADYQPWPACSVSDAITVLGRKPAVPLDLAIVNPSLPGLSYLITLFRRSQVDLKVMAAGGARRTSLAGRQCVA
jgi:hypothetical protein